MAEILSEFGHLVGLAGGNNIQATTMPTYSSVPLGTIVQYIGTTTADYINGYFYKATATGWEQHDTQPASNADNSITAFKESSPAQAAHAVDDYIRYNNVTYIVTAAIAIGDTLAIGTNIAVPTLDEGTVIYTPEAGGGSAGGGHVIVNPSGTEMEQRASLQFVDANVTDDSSNDKTKIENVKVINSESELANVSDGMYMGSYDDEADGVISADMIMYDSETTVEEELDNKVDKVTGKGLSTNDYDNIDKAKVNKIDETTTSVSGNPISISGLKSNQLAINPVITLEPIQAGSGDPSPSNVRAISGYDKIEVLSCGKNLVETVESGYYDENTGEKGSSDNYCRTSKFNVIGGQKYSLSVGVWGSPVNNIYYWKDDTYLGKDDISITSGVFTYTFTTREDANICAISCGGSNYPITPERWGNVMVEYGEMPTTYEPYNPLTDIQLTLGQTIYGGTLDVKTGVLTVDKVKMKLKDLVWESYTNPDTNILYFYSRTIHYTGKISPPKSNGIYCLCNKYNRFTGIDYNDIPNNSCVLGLSAWSPSSSDFVIRDNRYSSISDFTDSLTDDDIVVYQYTTENTITIQLTPHEISLLKDYAYVSTNGTNMSFSYKNGEMASLADVAQLGETVNALGAMPYARTIASATKNTTFANQMAELYPYANKLSLEDKEKSIIVINNGEAVWRIYNALALCYGGLTIDDVRSYITSIRLSNQLMKQIWIDHAGNISVVSLENKVNESMELRIIN